MTAKNLYDEKQCLSALSSSDQNALTEIYRAHWQNLFISAFKILKDKFVCEDLVQELFLDLWKQRKSLNIRGSLDAYLHTAIRYKVFRYIRTARARQELYDRLPSWGPAVSDEPEYFAGENMLAISNAIEQLPEKCRQIFNLSRESQLSRKEIAYHLHISVKTVDNQMTIATRKLRKWLQDSITLVLLVVSFF